MKLIENEPLVLPSAFDLEPVDLKLQNGVFGIDSGVDACLGSTADQLLRHDKNRSLDFITEEQEFETNDAGIDTFETTPASIGTDYEAASVNEAFPPPSEWLHRPLFIASSKSTVVSDNIQPSVPFQFESELFAGTAIIRIPTEEGSKDLRDVDKQIHRFQVAVQGKFKEPLSVADVLTGQEFERKLKGLPPRWMVKAGTAMMRRIAPGIELDLYSERPTMLANLAATTRELRADNPGSEPSVASLQHEENSELLVGDIGDEITAHMRKRFLSSPDAVSKLEYDTDTTYTFNFYQEMLDVETLSLDFGFTKLSIKHSLNGQPIQILAKTRDGRYLWSFQVWHEDLVSGLNSK